GSEPEFYAPAASRLDMQHFLYFLPLPQGQRPAV
ncbi:MAG: hypothetical protein ACI8QF_004372, partial [Limisphaerales bacterium]